MVFLIRWVFLIASLQLKRVQSFCACCYPAQRLQEGRWSCYSNWQVSFNPSSLETITDIEAAEQELVRTFPPEDHLHHWNLNETHVLIIIDQWLRVGAPARAEALIDLLEVFQAIDGRMYEKVIDSWCAKALECGEKLMRWKSQNNQTFTLVECNQITKEGLDAANKACALLDRLEQLYNATGDINFRPGISTYAKVANAFKRGNVLVLNSYTETTDPISREKLWNHVNRTMEQLRLRRDRMYNHQQQQNIAFRSHSDIFNFIQKCDGGIDVLMALNWTMQDSMSLSTTRQYNAIIHALSASKKAWSASVAEGIFDYMVTSLRDQANAMKTTIPLIKPDIITINSCIHAWASIPDAVLSAGRSEKLLEKLRHIQFTDGLLLDVKPDKFSYNSIIKSYANAGNAVQANAILSKMESLYQSSGDVKIRPDLFSYSCVLHAYARASKLDSEAAKKAEDLLAQMYKSYKAGINPDIQPTTILFNNVINAYAERGSGVRAYMLLMLMDDMALRDTSSSVRPDIYTYNSVLKAIANSNETGSLNRAEQLVKKMQALPRIQPDIISYNSFIDIIARFGGKNAGHKAEEAFARLSDRGLKANAATYTSLINAWTMCGDNNCLRKSEGLLETLYSESMKSPHIQGSLPDTTIYNSFIKCVCKYDSIQKALEILSTMESFEANGSRHLSPNAKSYTIILDCIASNGKPDIIACDTALGILDRMNARFDQGFIESRPNVFAYSALIKCYARSKLKDKASRAFQILLRMEEDYRMGNDAARPNIIAYNSVLNACAYSNREHSAEEAFRIACLLFDEIRTSDYMRPTHVTYATFLKVIENMMPDSVMKNDLTEGIIRRCSRDGLISPLVMSQLSRTKSSEFLTKLLNGGTVIPVEWARNM